MTNQKPGHEAKHVVFVVPPKFHGHVPERVYGCSYTLYSTPNLAMLYAAAVLEQAGCKVEIIDDENLAWKDFINLAVKKNADFYVFHTVLLSTNVDIKAAKEIRKRLPESNIVFFGPHPTYVPNEFLIDKTCVVARGEAEYILRDIVEGKPKDEILGLSYIEAGKQKDNPTFSYISDIDKLPFPARHLDRRSYINPKLGGKKFTNILTSRGCAYRCYYCVPMSISWARELEWKKFHPGSKPPVTKRSAENIIAEFKHLAKEGYKEFSIIDDMFVWDKERILKICKGIVPLKIKYGILARADHIQDETLVKALAMSGCQYVDLGVESFDQKVLNYVKKDLDVKKVYRAVELLNKYKITPKINIMFGTAPIETRDSILKTIAQSKDLPVDFCMFSIATPFPGTEFEKQAKQHHWINKEYKKIYQNLDPAKKALISYKHLSDKDLEELVVKANREFYTRPKILLKQLGRTSSVAGLKQGAKTFIKLVSKKRRN
jgi:radical SAM superfamily enzyme YgiQ (UPF0313 family)